MGDAAEMVLEGILCQNCGTFLDEEGCGFPTNCSYCEEQEKNEGEEDGEE